MPLDVVNRVVLGQLCDFVQIAIHNGRRNGGIERIFILGGDLARLVANHIRVVPELSEASFPILLYDRTRKEPGIDLQNEGGSIYRGIEGPYAETFV